MAQAVIDSAEVQLDVAGIITVEASHNCGGSNNPIAPDTTKPRFLTITERAEGKSKDILSLQSQVFFPGTIMPGTRGPVPVPLKSGSQDITAEILTQLDTSGPFTTSDVFPSLGPIEIKAAVDRLANRDMIEYDTVDKEIVALTEEAEGLASGGSWEYRVWDVVSQKGSVGIKELPTIIGAEGAKVGQGNAFKLKWIKKDGDNLIPIVKSVEDKTQQMLQQIKETGSVSDAKLLADLRKRKLVRTAKAFDYKVRKGAKFTKEMPVEVTDLTSEMLANGSWQTANFKPYNFRAKGADQNGGALHPLNKVRAAFRQIFFEQGFVEMPTNRFVETGFWNFDALFVPQQHPARDLQDTFFIKSPAKADKPRYDAEAEEAMKTMEDSYRTLYEKQDQKEKRPRDYEQYWNDVRAVHEEGKFGSIGYRYKWTEDESLRLVLRTHTTAISTWVLHRLSEDPRPARYFSIDRVFRNEAGKQEYTHSRSPTMRGV